MAQVGCHILLQRGHTGCHTLELLFQVIIFLVLCLQGKGQLVTSASRAAAHHWGLKQQPGTCLRLTGLGTGRRDPEGLCESEKGSKHWCRGAGSNKALGVVVVLGNTGVSFLLLGGPKILQVLWGPKCCPAMLWGGE